MTRNNKSNKINKNCSDHLLTTTNRNKKKVIKNNTTNIITDMDIDLTDTQVNVLNNYLLQVLPSHIKITII